MHSLLKMPTQPPAPLNNKEEELAKRRELTTKLLEADKKKAQDILLQLRVQFSRRVSNIEIK